MSDRSPQLVRPVGHEDLVRGLAQSARAERLPHALLLEGPEGVGKFRAALWLATTLLCEREGDAPCLQCGPCKRVLAGTHADLFVVDARAEDQDELSIFFVTHRDERPKTAYQGPAIEDFLDLRASEGRGKFVVVRDAHTMNEAAQNAFLKMLEEPRPGVTILMTSHAPGALLRTVRSRVVRVSCEALDAAACADVTARALGLDPADEDDAERLGALVRASGGSPGIAALLDARAALPIAGLVGAALAGDRSASEVASELWDLDGDYPGRTPFVRRRSRAEAILDLGLEVLTDVERCASGIDPAGLRHGGIAGRIASSDALGVTARRRRVADAWLTARADLELNLSPEGLVDRALAASSPR
ncbi:MAG: hypothetical protein AAF957_06375 [Planctomycetota bacterium]